MRLICEHFYFLGAAVVSVPISGLAVLAALSVTAALGEAAVSPIMPSVSVTAPSVTSGVMMGVTFAVAVGIAVGTVLSTPVSAGISAPQPHRGKSQYAHHDNVNDSFFHFYPPEFGSIIFEH